MRPNIFNLLLTFPFILTSLIGVGQDTNKESPKSIGIKTGYFGEFVMHPGIYGGIEYSIRKRKQVTLHWDSEVGFFHHKWNNNSIWVQSTIGSRFYSFFNAFIDINGGIGYMLTAPQGDIYKVNEGGTMTENGQIFTSHLKPSFSFLLGWDGHRKNDIPLSFNFGLETYWQTHFNKSLLPHAALKIGVVYYLKDKK